MADDGLLREINEEVRAERVAHLWRQYRFLVAMVVVLVLVATIGNTLWSNYREQRGGEWLSQLMAAQTQFTQGKFAEAEKGFAGVAANASGDLGAVASIWQARALVGQGKTADAAALLQKTITQTQGLWGDVACLRLASIDTKAATCLASSKASPLKWQRMQWAIAERWHAGEFDQAIAMLRDATNDAATPEAARAELMQWLAMMEGKK
jgi:hypothetical protein